MIAPVAMLRESGRSAVQGWRTFWFSTEPAYTLGIIRIAFGVLAFLWSLELGMDLYDKFSVNGIVPQPPTYEFLWGVFYRWPGDTALLAGWIVLMVASLVMIVGWHTKLATFLVFLMIMSFERRNPWIFNSGDGLIRILSLYLALSPCGAALSLDQRRHFGSFWSAQDIKVWPLRLMQVQISIIYITTVIAKLHGDTWQNGSAVSYTLRLDDMLLLPSPAWVSTSPLIGNAMTWGTLLVEFSIGVLVWNKRWRTRVLIAGVFLHLTILLTMVVGFFSLAIFVLYLSFVPWERSKALADEVHRRLSSATRRVLRRKADAGAPEPAVGAAPEGDAVLPTESIAGEGNNDASSGGRHAAADATAAPDRVNGNVVLPVPQRD
ncbi:MULTISPECIES: HTTM domain-containing protein [unclassified Mycobacterium]|uniref:HTTM domain-containing protein n=1 Tax=unclassified Mycobacterium TaxID=2642494 RepID=UPI000491C745|nr:MULTISPECIES: HTTM domain-containing protein [unclassified Mycobacterium]SEB24223.1 Vitamin K-dependent gamma-carboxylase [Mycobacterium sp. 283mftsu]